MINAISIDLEDWFCVSNVRHLLSRDKWDECQLRVEGNTEKLLKIFQLRGVKATFFVLGWIVERMPGLIRSIEGEGHEIATHGYWHRMLTEMSPEEFSSDIARALDVTRGVVKGEVTGYRAPSFTIVRKTLWALEILKANGIRYDSSIYPISTHPDYGMAESPLGIYTHDNGIVEFPMSCAEFPGFRVPCSGGGYFRIFPYRLFRALFRRCMAQGRPVVFYLHPWEVDPGQPRVDMSMPRRFRQYVNLGKTIKRLDMLLGEFSFVPLGEILAPYVERDKEGSVNKSEDRGESLHVN